MGNQIKIAGIQAAGGPDVEKNMRKAGLLIELAKEQGASIVALPQLFNTRFFPCSINKDNFSLAEGADGPTMSFLKGVAKDHCVTIVASIFEKDGGGFFNTAFCLGPDGGIIGRYRKIHVPNIPLWEERFYFKKGNLGFPVFDLGGIKAGILLCWDVFFPECFRALALKGAELVIAPTASAFEHSNKKWETAIMAAAHANGMYVLRVNRVGREERQDFYGKSFCVGPDGEFILAPSGPSEGVAIAAIDLSEIARVRNDWVFLKDRRPEEYHDLVCAKGEDEA